MSQIQTVADAVAAGKTKLVGGLVQEALDGGCDAGELLNAMIDAMGLVGERFKRMKSLFLKCLLPQLP